MRIEENELFDFIKRDEEKTKNLPSRLYKYRAPDKYGFSMLEENEIFFSSFKNLNDPMEGKVPVLFEMGTWKQMRKMNEKMLENSRHLTKKERKRKAIELANLTYKNRNDFEKKNILREKHYKNLNQQIGVFSMSSISDDNLMWSHYSSSHKGFCIGFNTERLIKNLDELIMKGIVVFIDKVNYVPEIKGINPYKELDDYSIFHKKVFTKLLQWKYESEYRLLSYQFVNKSVRLKDNVIDSIIMGLNIEEKNEKRIKELLRSRSNPIKLLKANLSQDFNRLEFERIDY